MIIRALSICRSCLNSTRPTTLMNPLTSHIQTRFAGHAKWQNIKHTKLSSDLNKCRTISRYVLLVRRAIISNGMQADPKLNKALADVLSEASRLNVPKATLERAITRATNMKIISANIEIQGPGGCSLVCRVESENPNLLRRDIKKAIKKFDAAIMPENSIINMFKSQGYIRTATKTKDERDINKDFAEDAAIFANAQEVYEEIFDEAEDPSFSRSWVFITDAEHLSPCRGELEKQGFNVLSSVLELVPYNAIKFGPDVLQKVEELTKALRDIDQVVEIYNNLAPEE